jgi:hypothetical protein
MDVQVACKGCMCPVTEEHKFCPECGLITEVGQAVEALESIGEDRGLDPDVVWVLDSSPSHNNITWTNTIITQSHTNDWEEDDED